MCVCVCGGDHTDQRYRDGSNGSEGSEGSEGIGRDHKGSEGSPPIVRDRKRSELSEKLKDGRDLQLEIGKLGNWEFEN